MRHFPQVSWYCNTSSYNVQFVETNFGILVLIALFLVIFAAAAVEVVMCVKNDLQLECK